MKRFSSLVSAFTFVLVSIQIVSAQVQGQWVPTGTMQTYREFNAQVKLASGKVLSIGGINNNNILLASAEVYNPASGLWTLTGNMAQSREVFPAVVLTSGKVLVSGGLGVSTVLAAAELYDPTTGTWSSAGSLSVARFGHTATLLHTGKVLVTGGCTANPCSTSTDIIAESEVYDPVSNTWSKTGSLNTARYSHTAVLLKNLKVLAIGGSAGTSCELYDPSKGTWSKAASTIVPRGSNATTMLQDGKVLITGGAGSGRVPINSAELYDPSANTWTLTGNMTTGRYAHTATLLPDGTVLVAGGIGQPVCGRGGCSFIPTAKVDIYNEAAGTAGKFTAAASLPPALAYHSTTLLGSGEALTNGGSGTTAYCCVVVNTAEIYTPLTMKFSSSSLNFGLLKIGLTSVSQTVTVTNVSSHPAMISTITPSADYDETNTCPPPPYTLNSNQNCTITITFKPTAPGTRNGAVTLKDNDPGSPSQVIALTGVGETLALGFSPSSLNLGTVPVGSTSSQSVTLTNDGAAPVNLTGYSISPPDGTFTQIPNQCPATLNVQQTCTLTIVFRPPDVFTYKATLSVANNGNGTAQVPLTGTGADGQ